MKLTKKLTVIILAFLMLFAMSGCGGFKVIKEIANVDGQVISEGEFKYFLETVKQDMLTEAGLATEEEVESFWAGDIDGVNAAEVAKNKALEQAIRMEIANVLATEAGLTIATETKKQIEDMIDGGGDQVQQLQSITGLDKNALINLLMREQMANLYANHLNATKSDEFTPKIEDVVARYDAEYVRVKHIFISKTDLNEQTEQPDAATAEAEATETSEAAETTEAKEQTAEEFEAAQKLVIQEVYEKAKAGEDFESLIAEYNEDPGMEQNTNGYTFTDNSGMVQVFEDAAFALQVGQISEIIEQPQGWHVIKRYDLLTEGEEYTQYISSLTSEMATDIFDNYIDSLKGNYVIEINQGAVDGIKIK